jgi:hypothetical protein
MKERSKFFTMDSLPEWTRRDYDDLPYDLELKISLDAGKKFHFYEDCPRFVAPFRRSTLSEIIAGTPSLCMSCRYQILQQDGRLILYVPRMDQKVEVPRPLCLSKPQKNKRARKSGTFS